MPTRNLEQDPVIVESFMGYSPKAIHDHEIRTDPIE
jgi:hypothetical protein